MAPEAMQFVAQKVMDAGNQQVILTERGTSFGYHDLVVDFRGIPIMQKTGIPVVTDVTHSLQQPNQSTGIAGGQPLLIETIAKAAVATGTDGIFIETHHDLNNAKSDAKNMLPLQQLHNLIEKLIKIRKAIQE
jgi:2-dehydro-3-deoxyphosphooctonate aldolase (KDO 8-P synthase)